MQQRACQVSPPILTRPRGVHAATTVAVTPTSVLVPTSGAARLDQRRPYTVPTISHTNAAAKPTPFHGWGNPNRRATPTMSGTIPFLYLNSVVLAGRARSRNVTKGELVWDSTLALDHLLDAQTESIALPEGVVEDAPANGDPFLSARQAFHAGTLGEVEKGRTRRESRATSGSSVSGIAGLKFTFRRPSGTVRQDDECP
jgi:hypothetical protein